MTAPLPVQAEAPAGPGSDNGPERPPSLRHHRRRTRLVSTAAVLAAAVALVAVVWGPLVWRGSGTVIDDGDPLYEAWNLDWVQHAVLSGSPVFDANIFHPTPDALALSDTRIGPALVVLPVRVFTDDPTRLLTAALLIGVAANFVAAFAMAATVIGSRRAGWLAGTVYAFGPLPTFLMYHTHMTWRAGLPLAVLGIWRLSSRSRSDRVGLACLAGAALVSATTSVYQVAFLGLVVVCAWLVRRRELGWRGVAISTGALAVGALPGIPIALAHLRVANSADIVTYGLGAVAALSAHPMRVDGLVVAWRTWLGPRSPADRLILPTFVGAGPLAAALAAVVPRRSWRSPVLRLGVALGIVGAVLGVGAAPTGWRRFTPMRVLFELPLYNAVRGAGRYWVVALLGLALLAGLVSDRVASAVASRARGRAGAAAVAFATLALCAVPVAEGWPDLGSLPRVQVTALDRQLDRGSGGVAYLPLNVSANGIDFIPKSQIRALFRSTAHHRPILNGYSGTFPTSYLAISRTLSTLPDAPAVIELRRLGVRDVVVTRDAVGTRWESLLDPATAAPLELVAVRGGEVWYRVPSS